MFSGTNTRVSCINVKKIMNSIVNNQMSHFCGLIKHLFGPQNPFFICVIANYFSPFFFDHPVSSLKFSPKNPFPTLQHWICFSLVNVVLPIKNRVENYPTLCLWCYCKVGNFELFDDNGKFLIYFLLLVLTLIITPSHNSIS